MSGNAIWKFPLTGAWPVMPRGSAPLCVQMQGDQPTLWALVDPASDVPTVQRRIEIIGTGWDIGTLGDYVGTYQQDGLVWHVFDMGEAP